MGQKINSEQMALQKYVDANGWTVYDYGAWREYEKKITGISFSSLSGSGITNQSGGNYPAGVAPNTLYVSSNYSSGAGGAGRYYMEATGQESSTPGAALTIAIRNLTTSTLTESGVVMVVKCKQI